MTNTVIDMVPMDHPVKTLLEKCGSRQEVLADARAVDADLDLVAVHRWHQRGSVPPKYWLALVDGARKRRAKVRVDDFAHAHTPQGDTA